MAYRKPLAIGESKYEVATMNLTGELTETAPKI